MTTSCCWAIRFCGRHIVWIFLPFSCLLVDTNRVFTIAVFDLENNAIWMTQAASCGSTPAALRSANDLATLTGACGITNAGVTGGSSTSITGGGTASSGGLGGTDRSSTTAGSASGPASTGTPQRAPSFGIRCVDDHCIVCCELCLVRSNVSQIEYIRH